MKFHLSNIPGQNIFTAHGEGYVQVNERRYEQPIIVMANQIISDWPTHKPEACSCVSVLPRFLW